MPDAAAVDRLTRVLDDHPWLVTALREADWWVREDGGVRMSLTVEDVPDEHEGFIAFAEALGMELEQLTPGSTPAWDAPDEPPMTFDDLRRRLRRSATPQPSNQMAPVPSMAENASAPFDDSVFDTHGGADGGADGTHRLPRRARRTPAPMERENPRNRGFPS